jgi:hypothetical protein
MRRKWVSIERKRLRYREEEAQVPRAISAERAIFREL